MDKDHPRRYPIQADPGHHLHAGLTSENEQVLVGLFCPDLVAFYFDLDGNWLRTERTRIPFFEERGPSNIYDHRIPPLIEEFKDARRIRPATIRVKQFSSREHSIRTEDYPSHFREILDDPNESEEEKASIRESIQLWDQHGQFVLWWGNDFWLDETGDIVAS